MIIKHTLAAALVGAAMASFAPTAGAAPVDIDIRFGPPAPRVVAVPAPRAGYVWSPGHWDWNGRRHVWVDGSWLRDRPGYAYVRPQWVQHGDRWHFYRPAWAGRDNDRDGIPNRYDRDRNNDGWVDRGGRRGDRDRDGVRNRNDRDRDGDGVPNRFDNKPNNKNRN